MITASGSVKICGVGGVLTSSSLLDLICGQGTEGHPYYISTTSTHDRTVSLTVTIAVDSGEIKWRWELPCPTAGPKRRRVILSSGSGSNLAFQSRTVVRTQSH